MKKVIVYALFLLVFCTACSDDTAELKQITRDFVAHLNAGNNLQAGQISTESTKRFLAFRTARMMELGEATQPIMTTENIKCKKSETTATCTFCCDPNEEEFQLEFIKKDDKWLVNIDIDDLIDASRE